MDSDLYELMVPGATFWIKYSGAHNDIRNKKIHVRAIVDHEMVVTKYWSKYKQYWRYEIEPIWWYDMLLEQGVLFTKKPKGK